MSDSKKRDPDATRSFTVRVKNSLRDSLEHSAQTLNMKSSTQARHLLELSRVVKIVPKSRITSHDNKELMLVPREWFMDMLLHAYPAHSRERFKMARNMADFLRDQLRVKPGTVGSVRELVEEAETFGWFQPILGEDRQVLIPKDFGPYNDPDFMRAFFYQLLNGKPIPTETSKDGSVNIKFDKKSKEASSWRIDDSSPTTHYRIRAVTVEPED